MRCIVGNRIPHALLFTGKDGYGTVALATAFARVVNCEKPVKSNNEIDACGHCQACYLSSQLMHPNIQIVTSLPAGSGGKDDEKSAGLIDEIKSMTATLAEDPYSQYRLHNATQIRTDQIRELKRTLSLSASHSGRRVIIILNADEMNTESANSFLKTLEEPHDNVTIVLTTERPERLLQTISSRCQEVIVPPLDDQEVVQVLVERNVCTPEEAALVAPFAQGSFVRALEYLSNDVSELRESAINLLRAALKGRDWRIALMDAVNSITEDKNRVRAVSILSMLALWLRDVQLITLGGDPSQTVNSDHIPALERFSASFGNADMNTALDCLDNATKDISRNVSTSLVFSTTLIQLRKLFISSRQQIGMSQ